MSDKVPTTQNEEVDLGKLFQLIGKGFSNFFKAIGNFFKAILHYLILILIFFRKNALIIGIATILGGVIGYVLEKNVEDIYMSTMIVDTNYGSGHRLYKQIDLLNTLISEEDTIRLSEIFNIKPSKASTLNSFKVEPYDKEKNLVKEFDKYMQKTDTIFTRGFTVEKFAKRINNPDLEKQTITAYSSDKKIFNKLKGGIIELNENDYFKKRKKSKLQELSNRKVIVEKDLKVIDSLRNLYKNVAILSANNNTSSSTNIDLGGKQKTKNKDIELFNKNIDLVDRLSEINLEFVNYDFIIDPISEFNDGEKYSSLINSNRLKYAAFGFLLSLVVILAMRLNKYLTNYQK